jgi:hypothetical protein
MAALLDDPAAAPRFDTRLRRRAWVVLIAAVLLANGADLITFAQAIGSMGLALEQNPIARFLYNWAGLAGIVGLKAMVLGSVFTIAAILPSDRFRLFVVVATIVFGLVGTASNLLALNGYWNS